MKLTVAVPALPDLRKAVVRLARAAKRLHLEPAPELVIDWSTKTERVQQHVTTYVDGHEVLNETVRRYAVETVNAEILLPELGVQASGGWSPIARLERLEEGSLDLVATGEHLKKCEPYRAAKLMRCEHCNANRRRNTTFILENGAGELKQVGGECLKAYTTELDRALAVFEFRSLIGEVLDVDAEDAGEPGGGRWSGARYGRSVHVLREALALCCRAIRQRGGFSPSRIEIPNRFGGEPTFEVNPGATWRIAQSWLLTPKPVITITPEILTQLRTAQAEQHVFSDKLLTYGEEQRALKRWQEAQPAAEDLAKADELLAWMEALQVDASDPQNEFLVQLKEIVRIGECSDRKLALIAAMPKAKARWDDEQLPKADAPKGRCAVEGVIQSVKHIEGQFGMQTKILVRLSTGARVYGTLPGALCGNIGDRIAFTAAFEPKPDDPTFAFYSRPTKAKVLAPAA